MLCGRSSSILILGILAVDLTKTLKIRKDAMKSNESIECVIQCIDLEAIEIKDQRYLATINYRTKKNQRKNFIHFL